MLEWRSFDLNLIFPMLANKRRDISVGLILNGLTKDFVGFVRNYNMHNNGKTIGEIHAMLIEYEKGLPKKAETPQGGRTLVNELSVYLAELIKQKRKQVGSACSSAATDGLLKSMDDDLFDKCESCLSGKMTKKPFPHSNERAKDLLGIIHTDVCGPLRHVSRQVCNTHLNIGSKPKKEDKTPYELGYGKVPNFVLLKGYPKETMGYYFYFPPENKIVVARYAEFFEKRLISQEISGRAVDLEEIQEEEDTTPSEITSNIPQEVEGFEPPQEEVIPIRRSERPHRAPNRLCLNGPGSNLPTMDPTLDEDIYMVQPEGFVDPNHPRKVCKLQRSIYGLKQASRS
ncbi:retrotransposon protein, putative, ty1-copia subclass [Tanacetum coccineum]